MRVVLTVIPAVIALYAAEFVLTFSGFFTDRHLLSANPAMFDPIAATRRLRESGKLVYPITTEALYSLRDPGTPHNWRFYPLSAKSHSTIVLCNESGDDVLFQSDRHGFNNPDSVWDATPLIALVGDSFTQGECVGRHADIASHLRPEFVTLNTGVSGSGPLRELGILREYVAPLGPPIVVWLFFEGNDIEDIAAEMKTAAARYLDPAYSQNLITGQRDIDVAIDYSVFEALRARYDYERHPTLADFVLLRRLRRLIMPPVHRVTPRPAAGLAILDSTLAIAHSTVAAWGGKLIMVYLPDRRRFADGDHTTIGGGYDLDVIHKNVLATAARLELPVIDASTLFAQTGHPLGFWPSVRSHYDSAGYALVAAAILKPILAVNIRSAIP